MPGYHHATFGGNWSHSKFSFLGGGGTVSLGGGVTGILKPEILPGWVTKMC